MEIAHRFLLLKSYLDGTYRPLGDLGRDELIAIGDHTQLGFNNAASFIRMDELLANACYRDALSEWSPDEADKFRRHQQQTARGFSDTNFRVLQLADQQGFSVDVALDRVLKRKADNDDA